EDKAVVEKVGVVFPNQATTGTHVNISGVGVLKHAPNRDAAIKFLEYLTSEDAQRYFADGNNEWPVVQGVKVDNPALTSFGETKSASLNGSALGRTQPTAQRICARGGWK